VREFENFTTRDFCDEDLTH
jgi:hypothetical protein